MISRERWVQGQPAAPLPPSCLPAKQKCKVQKWECEIKEPKYRGKKEERTLK